MWLCECDVTGSFDILLQSVHVLDFSETARRPDVGLCQNMVQADSGLVGSNQTTLILNVIFVLMS